MHRQPLEHLPASNPIENDLVAVAHGEDVAVRRPGSVHHERRAGKRDKELAGDGIPQPWK